MIQSFGSESEHVGTVECGARHLIPSRALNAKSPANLAPDSSLYQSLFLLARRAFYPLTMPLTVGPGLISIAIAVGANRAPGSEARWTLPMAALLGCAVVAAIYLLYRFARQSGTF